MIWLVLAAALFLATHLLPSAPAIRPMVVERLGAGPFQIVYSIVALVSLVLLIQGWRGAPWIGLWEPGMALRHTAVTLMPIAFLLLVAGLGPRNPTSVAASGQAESPVTGVVRITRHPMMWAATIWAVLHILANGDLASLVLFGSIAILAQVGARQIDRRLILRDPARWEPFMAATSFVPLGAVLSGRQPLGKAFAEIGLVRIAIALVAYAALLVLHPHLFGVPALG